MQAITFRDGAILLSDEKIRFLGQALNLAVLSNDVYPGSVTGRAVAEEISHSFRRVRDVLELAGRNRAASAFYPPPLCAWNMLLRRRCA